MFLTEVKRKTLGSWTSAPSGYGCPHRNASFAMMARAWRKFSPPDFRRDIRVDVCGRSDPKTYSLGCFFVPDFSQGAIVTMANSKYCEFATSPSSFLFKYARPECNPSRSVVVLPFHKAQICGGNKQARGIQTSIYYKHPVLTLYGYGKILTEGISLIFWRDFPLSFEPKRSRPLKLRVLKDPKAHFWSLKSHSWGLKGINLKEIRSVPEKSELIEAPICKNRVFIKYIYRVFP